jgi:hypothetical protein
MSLLTDLALAKLLYNLLDEYGSLNYFFYVDRLLYLNVVGNVNRLFYLFGDKNRDLHLLNNLDDLLDQNGVLL